MAGLGRKTFTAGDVLTAAQVQGYLQDQAVMVFAGTAARSSAIAVPSEGMFSITTDNDQLDYYNGSAWVSAVRIGAWETYAPVISSGGSAPLWANGNGVYTYAKYCQIGKSVSFVIAFTFGSTTTKSTTNIMSITLPVTANTSGAAHFVGRSSTAGGSYFLNAITSSTTTIGVYAQNASATYLTLSGVTSAIPGTWVTTDTFTISGTYEAA
jgi:hypothetical protein